jgi:hypothetical protein
MKKFGFILLCACFHIWQASAQINNNTIVNDNNSWAILTYGLGAFDIPCCVKTHYVFFENDSLFSGNSYKKVFSYEDQLHENLIYKGLMREQDEKTYFIPANSETEYLLE